MNTTTKYEVKASVYVDSDETSSAELTAILGLEPDTSWDAGSPTVIAGKVKHRRFNCWSVDAQVHAVEHTSDAIDRVLSRVSPIQDRFLRLPSRTRTALLVTFTIPDTVFAFSLTLEQMQFCKSIGASVQLSFEIDALHLEHDRHFLKCSKCNGPVQLAEEPPGNPLPG